MKKFILSAVLLTMLTATYAQYTIRIIPIIDRRMEIGFFNSFNFYSISDEIIEEDYGNYARLNEVDGGIFNPGVYFSYGHTRDWNSQYVSTEHMVKLGLYKRSFTLQGEEWEDPSMGLGSSGTSTPFVAEFEDLYVLIQGEIMLKLHLMNDELEASAGIFFSAPINLKDIFYDFSLLGGPQLKATYKMDNFYFSGTLGFDLLTTVGATNNLFAEFLDFPDYRNYTKNVPFVLSIGFGYIL